MTNNEEPTIRPGMVETNAECLDWVRRNKAYLISNMALCYRDNGDLNDFFDFYETHNAGVHIRRLAELYEEMIEEVADDVPTIIQDVVAYRLTTGRKYKIQ